MTKPKPIEPVYRQFGAKVEQLRIGLDITQLDLAKRIGLKRTSIANIENGKQRILLYDVERFALALGTTPKGLLRGIWL
jgi:transcriptional regulator with XRE-family HTH domain